MTVPPRFDHPTGIAVDAAGIVYVADDGNGTIRKITADGAVSTLAGKAGSFGAIDGPGDVARFSATHPGDRVGSPLFGSMETTGKTLVAAPNGTLFVADYGNAKIRKISPSGQVTTYAGSTAGYADAANPVAKFGTIQGIALEMNGDLLVTEMNNETVRRITPSTVTTFAGHRWFRHTAVGGQTTPLPSILPVDGNASTATFLSVRGIAVAPNGDIYALDQAFAGAVRKIAPDGSVTTLAGTLEAISAGHTDGVGSAARFASPVGLAIDSESNIFVTDLGNRRIRRVTRQGVVTTIAGSVSGTADGLGANATFISPSAICIDRDDNLYIADTVAHTIRKGTRVRKPEIITHPNSAAVVAGSNVILSVTAKSFVPITYQWMKDGATITGATNGTLTLSNVTESSTGAYAVIVSNAAGATTSSPATLSFAQLPVIAVQPSNQSLLGGQSLNLSIQANGSGTLTYQWQKDGADIPGATTATYTRSTLGASDAGAYRVAVFNGAARVISEPAMVTVNTTRIVNLSIRSVIGSTNPLLTVGFVGIGGNKTLLARAIGPSLRQFNVDGAHSDPRLTLYAGAAAIGANDDWSSSADATRISDTAARVGAFGLPPASADAAVLGTFPGGAYTVQISGPANSEGIVLVELYDANNTDESRLINVSARAQVGTGENLLVAGFVITGNAKKTLLIRAVGPTLAEFGVTNALADPRLELIRAGSTSALIANDNWGGTNELSAAFTLGGAFPLTASDSKDAVLLVTLDPGSYSAQVSGVDGTTGEALLEVYELP